MQQIISTFLNLELKRRLFVVAAVIGTIASVLLLARIASEPQLSLLYSGLEPAAASEVLASLEQAGAVHEVRGASIYVDATRRDALRIMLAGEGKPSNGTQGYELLDGLSGFSTTSQMFDATYWRAVEGELARTLMASPFVRSARVHVAQPPARGLRRTGEASASIVVTTNGTALAPEHVEAFRFLVASAVAGLSAERVSVIDTRGGLLLGEGNGLGVSQSNLSQRETEIKKSLERLLTARVGPGRAVVEVSVEANTQREQITERIIDPEGRVPISSDTQERTSRSSGASGSPVTVASNLAEEDGAATDASSSSEDSETRELVNYEVSETQREVVSVPGSIKRLTVAVLVDGIRSTSADGTPEWLPRPQPELDDLKELLAAAAGINEARGDTITVRSLEFQVLAEPAVVEPGGTILSMAAANLVSILQAALLAVVALVLGLFVVRPALTSSRGSAPALPAPLGAPDVAFPSTENEIIPAGSGLPDTLMVDNEAAPPALPLPDLDLPGSSVDSPLSMDLQPLSGQSADPVSRLRDLIFHLLEINHRLPAGPLQRIC